MRDSTKAIARYRLVSAAREAGFTIFASFEEGSAAGIALAFGDLDVAARLSYKVGAWALAAAPEVTVQVRSVRSVQRKREGEWFLEHNIQGSLQDVLLVIRVRQEGFLAFLKKDRTDQAVDDLCEYLKTLNTTQENK
jgi:hypothetical protein